ncbi:Retrovirus-related Pol polyprotein from transposon RE1 [Vitis vinifera]|uniref:Retrovirus-related Pol polyprotein from transposon RE1 n=1 Tax=Vitis vinifera TaxID=29760 RepID=A0A438DZD6_VITVI|nr:Retrovirus-related Pol polyprotein from transposon RE1 [Vitis vinifera]
MITSEKLVGSENYLSWSASVELWFMGQGYEDHLITQETDIPEPQDLDLSTYIGQIASLKEQFLTVMPLTPDILGSSSVPSLDDVFARLLRISSTQTLPSDSASDSSVLVSQTTSRGGRSGTRGRGQRPHCTYCNKLGHTRDRCYQLHGRPPRTAHMAQSSDSPLPQPPSSSASQTSQASIASVAQPGNASACLTHTSSLGPWILDSGASDHLSGIGLALPLPSLPLTSVLYTPECPFNLISISKITRTLNCSITFSDKFVTLQDRSTGKTIGIGRESQGLYHLTSDSSPAVCISTDALSSFTIVWATLVSPSSRRCPITSFMSHHGILHQSSCAHTPQQNGVAERKNRHLVETARTLLLHNHVPFRFWGDAVLTACYLINRMPSSVLHDQIPHSLLFPDQPLYFLPPRVFGCTCFVHILTPGQDKLSAKAMKCLFLGYSRLQKGYRCYSLETHRYFISADVTFLRTHHSFPPLLSLSSSPSCRCPLPFPEAPADSLPIPSASPAPALPSPNDLPIAVRKVKVGPDGQVDRLKARLVAKGYTQVYGSDYGDTFSPVAKIASVRLLLSMAAMCSWPLYQLDIKNAFLHGDLARKFIWSNLLCIYLVVYVDDIVITGSDQDGIQKLKQHLFTHFQTKDLGKLKYFLGIEIAQSSSGVVLSQRKYALDILEETGMLDCKPVDTPMDPNVKLVPGQGEPLGDPGRYRRLVGQGVLYENRGHTQVVGYTDADWAGSPTDRRSTSGYCVFIGGNLISWKSKKQDVVARSSAEAEYRAMALATCELIWLRHLLQELRFGKDEQMKLIVITRPALHIASNPVFHERTKHIEVDCHFIREKIASGCVATSFVNSNDQLADIFTKSLRGPRIKYICNKLGAYDVYAPA